MKSSYNKIYDKSPIWLQNILISMFGYKLYRQRYGKTYKKYFNEYLNKDYSDIESELEYQSRELQRLVKHAVNNSPFYREFYKGIDTTSIKTVDDLKKLPILEKEILRENVEKIYTLKKEEGITGITGGTTGKSLVVVFTKDDFQKRMAYLDAFKARLGIRNGMRRATFSGRQFTTHNQKKRVFWRYNFVLKQKFYSTFDMVSGNLPLYIRDLNKFKPETINGFVSAIYDIAKFVEDNNIALDFKPIGIFTTSETLLPFQKELIERVFSCPVYDQYASAEGAPFITECKNRNLHYNLDTGIIEPLETDHGTEMLVTSFTSYGTPLIRYRIEDKVEFSDRKCSCGNCHPLVEKIEGRQVDYLYSKERGKVSLSHLADVIKGMPNCIIAMQFIQDKIDEIEIKLVVDEKQYKEQHEHMILEEMKYRFGESMKFRFVKVNEIPKESSGKHRLIKNSVGIGEEL